MDPTARYSLLESLCPEIDPLVRDDFAARMDPEYFEQFPPATIAAHLRLLSTLTPERPCAVTIQPTLPRSFTLTIVAYDYFSEFAAICGLLSAFGLDIRDALIFTYIDSVQEPRSLSIKRQTRVAPQRLRSLRLHHPGLSRKKVVDVFHVQSLKGFRFTQSRQHELATRLTEIMRLLEANQVREVRQWINRQLTETLGKIRPLFSDCLHPVSIHFDNTLSPTETVIDIRSTDSPAFLYAFANALTMRGIYLSKAHIEVEGARVHNRFYIRNRHGQKIMGKHEQDVLSFAAALIKEFTHFLSWAPDPGKALEHFDQFLDQCVGERRRLLNLSSPVKHLLLVHLAQLFGSSDFLWEDFLRRQHANLLPLLTHFQATPLIRPKSRLAKALRTALGTTPIPALRKERLNRFKDQELFRIDMKHLIENAPLSDFSQALTTLAEVVLHQAFLEAQRVVARQLPPPRSARGDVFPFAICGLGKFGGRELGYASDIEVLFVYGTANGPSPAQGSDPAEFFERVAQEILRWIEAKREGIFHVDTRLRPHGEKGVLANSFEAIRHYYSAEGMAAPFERQALIKLRAVAGNRSLGLAIERHRDTFVYSSDPWPLETALHLRKRQMTELVPPGSIHVKYSPGGLIDIEYTVQYLQLMYGHRFPTIRIPSTLEALEALQQENLLSPEEASSLKEDYLFFRKLIDALRLERGNASDLLLPPPASEAMIFLARRLGFITDHWEAGAHALAHEIRTRMKRIHKMFTEKFARKKRVRKT
ncbi:MAG: hypothetical protein D6704_01895 [Nitrospirae bacterium]|nr:MAG: hypothetical protein D6704_01895 [Nitrospirota bacterium]